MRVASLLTCSAVVAHLVPQPTVAAGFDRAAFEAFVASNMGTDGRPVYWYSTGTVRSFPGGRLLAQIEGVDMARMLRREPDGTVHKASRKMYILRDAQSGTVLERIAGQPQDRYFYPYQYMLFRLEGDRLAARSTQGSGAALRTVDIGSAMDARRVGEHWVFSAPNARESADGTGSFEMYEFWIPANLRRRGNPPGMLTLTLVNWHPIGEGRPVYTHRTSWRIDRYEALPKSLRDYIEVHAPLYREPPRDLAEIERLQQGDTPSAAQPASQTRS